jgi:hypothetical protein
MLEIEIHIWQTDCGMYMSLLPANTSLESQLYMSPLLSFPELRALMHFLPQHLQVPASRAARQDVASALIMLIGRHPGRAARRKEGTLFGLPMQETIVDGYILGTQYGLQHQI